MDNSTKEKLEAKRSCTNSDDGSSFEIQVILKTKFSLNREIKGRLRNPLVNKFGSWGIQFKILDIWTSRPPPKSKSLKYEPSLVAGDLSEVFPGFFRYPFSPFSDIIENCYPRLTWTEVQAKSGWEIQERGIHESAFVTFKIGKTDTL